MGDLSLLLPNAISLGEVVFPTTPGGNVLVHIATFTKWLLGKSDVSVDVLVVINFNFFL